MIPVGTRPFGVTVDRDTRNAYTANVGSDDVSVIDMATLTVRATVKVEHHPYAVALAGRRAFVTNQSSSTVTVFDTDTLAVVKTIEVGDTPEGIEADPDGRYVYVACWFDNTLEQIDTETLEVTAKVKTGGDGPRAFGQFLR